MDVDVEVGVDYDNTTAWANLYPHGSTTAIHSFGPVTTNTEDGPTGPNPMGELTSVLLFQTTTAPYGYGVDLDDIVVSTGAPPATSFTWNADGVGDWATPNNWNFDNRAFSAPNPNIRANNPNHTAIFDNVISTPTTVVTNAAVTVNRIEFNNTTNGYVVAGHGSVNLASTTAMIPVAPTVSVMGTRSRQSLHWQITRFE